MLAGSPITILLVEDDDAHAEIVRRNLEAARVANQIRRVRDGQQALDYLRGTRDYASPGSAPRPDLVLLDLRLPRVDGLTVLKLIKEDTTLRSIPTVVLTTSRAEQDMVTAYGCGAASYLVKPVDFGQFTELMASFGFYWLAWNRYPHEPGQPS
jgi:CheY-like chemotaxis protein